MRHEFMEDWESTENETTDSDGEDEDFYVRDQFNGENAVKVLLYIGIATGINTCWQAFELLFYGVVRPDAVDTIMGLAFAWVAYRLLRTKYEVRRGE